MKQLKQLTNGRIQKINQISDDSFLFVINVNRKKYNLVINPQIIFFTEKEYKITTKRQFYYVLRKYLLNKKIQDIRKHKKDRIVEIETNDDILYLELFRNGNIILTDKENIIRSALVKRSWRTRIIKPRSRYEYPPLAEFTIKSIKIKNINEILEKRFEEFISEGIKKDDRIERIRKSQEAKLRELQMEKEFYEKYARDIYRKYDKIQEEFKKIKDPSRKVRISGILLDPRKNLKQNAAYYFDEAKKMKIKISNLKTLLKKPIRLEKGEIIEKPEKIQRKEKEWYDQFRWFRSSDEFLVVAGKDAKSNEKLIKKYMKKHDIVFHADITGSPFVLVKNPENKKIPDKTIKQAAEFCGSYSKAWKVGISAVDVYYINPEQVKKKGGLPIGSFIIEGKRNWIRRIPVRIAVGIEINELLENKIVYGPLDFVREKVKNYVIIVPGKSDIDQLRKQIVFDISKQELQKIIPYSKGEIVK